MTLTRALSLTLDLTTTLTTALPLTLTLTLTLTFDMNKTTGWNAVLLQLSVDCVLEWPWLKGIFRFFPPPGLRGRLRDVADSAADLAALIQVLARST